MTHRILRELPPHVDARVVFANTGQEDERTLNFVRDCQEVFGWDVTWVEAEVSRQKGEGTRHKVARCLVIHQWGIGNGEA